MAELNARNQAEQARKSEAELYAQTPGIGLAYEHGLLGGVAKDFNGLVANLTTRAANWDMKRHGVTPLLDPGIEGRAAANAYEQARTGYQEKSPFLSGVGDVGGELARDYLGGKLLKLVPGAGKAASSLKSGVERALDAEGSWLNSSLAGAVTAAPGGFVNAVIDDPGKDWAVTGLEGGLTSALVGTTAPAQKLIGRTVDKAGEVGSTWLSKNAPVLADQLRVAGLLKDLPNIRAAQAGLDPIVGAVGDGLSPFRPAIDPKVIELLKDKAIDQVKSRASSALKAVIFPPDDSQ